MAQDAFDCILRHVFSLTKTNKTLGTFARKYKQKKKSFLFAWYFARLIVPLTLSNVLRHDNANK